MTKTLVQKLETEYQLTKGKYTLNVVVYENSKVISLWPFSGNGKCEFIFQGSKPEDIRAIAALMVEATKLIKQDVKNKATGPRPKKTK